MASLIIRDGQGNERRLPLEERPVRIGKKAGNEVVLTNPNVSRDHCVIMAHDGRYYLRDLRSKNGTYVNSQRVSGDTLLEEGARIQILDYVMIFTTESAAAPSSARRGSSAEADGLQRTPVHLKRRLHEYIIATLDLKHADFSRFTNEQVRDKTTDAARKGVATMDLDLPPWLESEELVKEVVDEAVGLGPLEDLLADDEVDEIMVNGWDKIYVERHGKLTLSAKQFTGNEQVLAVIRRILAPLGRRIDESSPMVDARLADGSRVNAIIAPLSLTGPTLTIRKFSKTPFTVDDLIERFDSLTPPMAEFMSIMVKYRANVCISGGTGSGKTTFLNVLSNFIPDDERIVTIEDAAELQLRQDHVVSLEAKPANIEGKGAIPIRKLVINSLRMRPDRIVVGECRGGEALDMLQAMNTGHDGSLTTLHANTPRDALRRLETLVLMAGMDLPSRAIREQISSAINFIVQQSRMPDGTRKIVKITEILGLEGEDFKLEDVFVFDQTGFDESGKVVGAYRPTGYVPRFVKGLLARGVEIPATLFKP